MNKEIQVQCGDCLFFYNLPADKKENAHCPRCGRCSLISNFKTKEIKNPFERKYTNGKIRLKPAEKEDKPPFMLILHFLIAIVTLGYWIATFVIPDVVPFNILYEINRYNRAISIDIDLRVILGIKLTIGTLLYLLTSYWLEIELDHNSFDSDPFDRRSSDESNAILLCIILLMAPGRYVSTSIVNAIKWNVKNHKIKQL